MIRGCNALVNGGYSYHWMLDVRWNGANLRIYDVYSDVET